MGTANTPYLPNTVWLVPCITEPKQYALTHSCKRKKKTICAKPSRKCKYPIWATNRARIKSQNPVRRTNSSSNNQNGQKKTINKNIYMVVPYQKGLSERFKNTCQKYGVQVHFKGGQTIKDLLMAPKDKDPITSKSGVIYIFKCSEDGCEEEYIGESARTFAERFKEHQKSPSPAHDHCNISGHKADINNFSIIGREDQNLTQGNQEALFHKGQ